MRNFSNRHFENREYRRNRGKAVSAALAMALMTGLMTGCGTETASSETASSAGAASSAQEQTESSTFTVSAEDAASDTDAQSDDADGGDTGDGEKLNIVATIFPEYDWVREILGDQADQAEVTMLLDNGVDLHSYQPTADDLVKVSNCDLFIYVGGESDAWVEDALKNATNPDMKVINLLDVLGDQVKEEETVEGMEPEEEEKGSE